MPGEYQMRQACNGCGSNRGQVRTTGPNDCVWCLDCGKFNYNAPRTETGRPVRHLRTRPDIKPSQRARILDRDNATCVICHRHNIDLDIGHLLSVEEGRQAGLTDLELYDDENLAAMCTACNSGYSSRSINPRLLVALLRARRGGETA